MKAQFIQREIYGNVLYYPANDTAEKLCRFVKVKTMPQNRFKEIQELGFEVQVVNQYEIKRD